ncbi:WD repeat-containing protein 70-like [Tubulanus polymorphus]|uniref:WD repeat-containing protein 70-like n=1 Tax=Tubulanus polymorphus TaxID=672921 RepID=UPI003DA3710E
MAEERKAEKKPKTFDFMAMFNEARKTAMERSEKTLAEREDLRDEIPENLNKEQKDRENLAKTNVSKSKWKSMSGSSESDVTSTKPSTSNQSDSDDDDDDDDDDDMIGPPIPASMGISKKNDDDDEMMGPPIPPTNPSAADEEDDDEEDEEEKPVNKIPASHEISLDHGSKTISAMALDPSGARLVTGSIDYDVRFWDFAGMDARFQSFRSVRPCESHAIRALEYSPTGENILVVAGNSQAKIIDRDGFEIMECPKGDQYLTDQARTKGHSAMLNSGCWHPRVKNEFMTCANDGTLRIWNVGGTNHKFCVKCRSAQGRKAVPTACTFSNDGRWVAAACQDGSIQIWDHNKTYVNVAMCNRTAHMNGTETSKLCFSYDGQILASRGGDDTVKLWDIRNFKKPVHVAENLYNRFSMTDVLFSPDDQMVITGLSLKKGETEGKLVFLDRNGLNKLSEMVVSESSVVRCIWHPKLNQMVVGCGDGQVKVYYDPDKSHRGAKLCVVKTKAKSKQVEVMASQNVITPYALPMFRKDRPKSTRKHEEKNRKDPIKSHRPDLPVSGPGVGGRVGAKGATLSQYVVQNLIMKRPDPYENDPRGAILRHAKEASDNPFWISPAYTETQPHTVFHNSDDDDEKEEPTWKKQKVK